MKTLFTSLIILLGISINLLTAQCSTEVIIEQGVECKLPKITSSNQFLLPCNDPFMITNAPLGTKFMIDFIASSCVSICQQGMMVDIICANILTGTHDIDLNKIKLYTSQGGQLLNFEVPNLKSVYIIDMSGIVLQHSENRDIKSIDISTLPPGIYIARITTDSGSGSIKFVK